jgi:hypothetical protein
VFFRTLSILASLYTWGSPILDPLRPNEIDFASRTVREVFEPSVNAASKAAWTLLEDYMPPEMRQIRALGGPLAQLNDALGQAGKKY